MDKRYMVVALFFSFFLLLSGCLTEEQRITSMVEDLPEVEGFISEQTDHNMEVVLLEDEYVDHEIDAMEDEVCEERLDSDADYYRAVISGEERMEVWVERNDAEVVCKLREGEWVDTRDHKDCYQGDVWWHSNHDTPNEKYRECESEEICEEGVCVGCDMAALDFYEATLDWTNNDINVIVGNTGGSGLVDVQISGYKEGEMFFEDSIGSLEAGEVKETIVDTGIDERDIERVEASSRNCQGVEDSVEDIEISDTEIECEDASLTISEAFYDDHDERLSININNRGVEGLNQVKVVTSFEDGTEKAERVFYLGSGEEEVIGKEFSGSVEDIENIEVSSENCPQVSDSIDTILN